MKIEWNDDRDKALHWISLKLFLINNPNIFSILFKLTNYYHNTFKIQSKCIFYQQFYLQ